MIRAFFGLAVDNALGAELAGTVRVLKPALGPKARWVARPNYHVTLAFLGNVGEDDRAPLHGIARRVAAETAPFDIEVQRIGWFPSARCARMVAAMVRRRRALVALADRLQVALAAAGFTVDSRRLRPHITLARLTSTPATTPEWPELQWRQPVVALALFRSDRIDDAVVYNSLFECRLGGGERES